MPEKSFSFPLSDAGDVLWVRVVTEHGDVVDYSLRYETLIEGEPFQVVLCDGTHGRGHCHRMSPSGEKLDRVWARKGLSLGDALTEQIEDVATNWQVHLGRFTLDLLTKQRTGSKRQDRRRE